MTVREKINAIVTTASNFVGYSRTEIGLNKSTEWCAEFVSFCLKAGEEDDVTSISCNDMYKNMTNSTHWCEPDDMIKTGDVIFFNWCHTWDNGRPLDHVGIVIDVAHGYVTYVDGNSDSTEIVRMHTRSLDKFDFNHDYPDKYMRLTSYSDQEEAPQEEAPPQKDTKLDTAISMLKEVLKIFEEF